VVPEQATVWGLGYVLAEEHHELWGGLIDSDPAGSSAANAEHLLRLLSARPAEDRVAFRGDSWLRARLARLPQPESGRGATASPLFRPDGAYLVTGGFGDIALKVAEWAAGQGARRLILLGRTKLPPRDQWRALPPESAAGRRAAAIQKLEALGAAVHWAAVDVGDRASLAGFLDHYAAEGWPAVRGVIHAAAVIDDRLLVELDADSLRRVVHSKAAGAWNLHQYFLGQPLDFFVLFSSSGSLMGAAGQASYAAANAFADALAHARHATGAPALSINWGFWKDLGFALTPGGRRAVAYMRGFGMLPFEAPQALEALGRLLSRSGPAQAAAMRVNWAAWHKHSRLVGVPPFLRRMEQPEAGEAPEQAPAVDLRERLLRLEPGPPRLRHLREHIRSQLAAVLRVEPTSIDDDTALGSLGIDSFSAIELRNRFERSLGLRLSATLVWNYPTITAMAPHLAEKMGLDGAAAEAGGASAPETLDDDLAEFLAQAGALSDDDLRKLLNDGAAHE
jgi:myxalamid-type polyketide synthase MxaE and MxaD